MDYFKLHGNCFLVKGYSEALIYDLFQRRTIAISLNIAELYETEFIKNPYHKVLEKYDCWKNQIEKVTRNLINNDFAFFTNEPDSFPSIDMKFKFRSRIYSCIIEFDNELIKNYAPLIDDLVSLDCKIFYFIVRTKIADISGFKKMLSIFKESKVTWVQIIMDRPYLNFDELKAVTNDMRIRYKIFSSFKNEIIKGRWWYEESKFEFDLVEYCSDSFNFSRKSHYSIENFVLSKDIFIESQSYNPFFNNKICIDSNGNFKNDLCFDNSFGNFQSKSLQELLTDEHFLRLWNLRNDDIEKCKDCQYKYQCLSNSDVIKHEDSYHKKDECNFDPYMNIWN